jgi:hypothetical protein
MGKRDVISCSTLDLQNSEFKPSFIGEIFPDQAST